LAHEAETYLAEFDLSIKRSAEKDADDNSGAPFWFLYVSSITRLFLTVEPYPAVQVNSSRTEKANLIHHHRLGGCECGT